MGGSGRPRLGLVDTQIAAMLGGLGGLAVFGAGVWALLRGIFRQISATEENTTALHEVRGQLEKLGGQVSDNTQRIARLEGRRR